MKIFFTAALAVAASMIVVMSNADANPAGVEWKSISQALEDAPKQNKLILLDVYTDWCGWCKRMDRDTYADSSIAAYLGERFISSKMNPEKDGKVSYESKEFSNGQFGQALGINSYPATAFFNEKGELLTVVSGYVGAKDFLVILKFFGDGAYLNTKWDDYVAQNKEAEQDAAK